MKVRFSILDNQKVGMIRDGIKEFLEATQYQKK